METAHGGPASFTATLQLHAVAGGATVTLQCDWSSDNPQAVSVDHTGLCRKHAPGRAVITATYTDEDGASVADSCPVSAT